MTGVGGGSLMTPLLVLLFGFHPATAVGTDLLYASVTKTVGTAVHGKQKTVDWQIVTRLAMGSVPASMLTLLVMSRVGTMSGSATSVLTKLGGLACAAGALAAWTWYAVVNARYLQANTHFNGNEWSVLWGIVTGVLGALLWVLVLLLPSGTVQAAVSTERWQMFWAVSLALAVGGSWLGNTLWNAAAKRLPLTLSGQMIAFETLFALLYAFVYDARLPRLPEILAIVLLLAGVSWSVRQHAVGKPASRAELEAPAH